MNTIQEILNKLELSFLGLFENKSKGSELPRYSKYKEYRGLKVLFTVEELRKNDFNSVKVTVNCDLLNKGAYMHSAIDEKSIENAFNQLFSCVKKYIDNYLDYDNNINAALSKLNAD